jgi:hypothetical protein
VRFRMPDEKKFDPFKPAQPTIPGVSPAGEETESAAPEPPPQLYTSESTSAQAPLPWRTVAIIVAIVTIGGLVYWARGSSSKPPAVPPEAATATPSAVAEAPKADQKLLIGPGLIATTSELDKAWSAKRFLFRDPLATDPVPAMVVRLPGGEYWGLSLREPFGTCELEYMTDVRALETTYNFHANHPMVVNPCTHAVYDLMHYSSGATDGGLVRGEVVSGPGVRPPMAIEIRIEVKRVRAVRME